MAPGLRPLYATPLASLLVAPLGPRPLEALVVLPTLQTCSFLRSHFSLSPGPSASVVGRALGAGRGFLHTPSRATPLAGVLPELEHLLRVGLLLHRRSRPTQTTTLLAVALRLCPGDAAALHRSLLVATLASTESRPDELPAAGVTAPTDALASASATLARRRLVAALREAIRP